MRSECEDGGCGIGDDGRADDDDETVGFSPWYGKPACYKTARADAVMVEGAKDLGGPFFGIWMIRAY